MIMCSIQLNADYPELNIRRSYFIEAGQDLFGDWIVEISYGRIGCKSRKKATLLSSEEAAKRAVRKHLRRRESAVQRIGVGYVIKLFHGRDWVE